jgi:hypothetical protein
LSARLLRFDIFGLARGGIACTTGSTGLSGVGWVGRVKPEHVDFVIVPDRQDQNHTLGHSLVHGGISTLGQPVVAVTKGGLLSSTEFGGDGIESVHAGDVGLGVLDDLAVLDVETANLLEGAVSGSVAGNELGDDGEFGLGVYGHAFTVEGSVTHAVRVEVASILVAHSAIAVVAITALGSRAPIWTSDSATVRGIGSSDLVGFPDIHLRAARAVFTLASVLVVGRAFPSFNVSLERELSDRVKYD